MLMNGKEVKHLVISGETYDKSYVGKKAKLVAINGVGTIYTGYRVNLDGSIDWTIQNGQYVTAYPGDLCFILNKYKNAFYIANVDKEGWHGSIAPGPGCGQGWVYGDNLEILN